MGQLHILRKEKKQTNVTKEKNIAPWLGSSSKLQPFSLSWRHHNVWRTTNPRSLLLNQQRLKTDHQVRPGIQNHQQAPRLDEHAVIVELIIVVLNNILSRLKIIIYIIISKRLSIDPRSSLKRCTK